MKFAKALAPVLAASLLATSLLCSCDSDSGSSRKTRNTTETEIELPEDEILVLCGYQNGFEGYSSSKLFILSDGRVFCSQEQILRRPMYYGEGLTDEQRIELLDKYTTPVAVISEKDMRKLYGYMVNIDPDAEMDYEDLYVTDIGTDYTNVYVDGKCIRISESGEMTGVLDDRNAKKADAFINKTLKSYGVIDYPNVYTGYEVFLDTMECPKTFLPVNGRRIITNAEELKEFEKETGLKLSGMEEFKYFGDPDYDYFSEFVIAVQIFNCPYVEEPDKAEAFIVSDNYVGFASLEADHDGGAVVDTYEGKVKTCCHIAVLPYYGNDTSSPYDPFIG